MKLTGTVKKVELFGAFVDVGVGRDGLVHISALSSRPVTRVEDVVKEGDTITVWVRRVDTRAGRIDLTLVEPAGLDWDEIKSGQTHTGRVAKIEKFGAFVDIAAERAGLVHISELASYRVDQVTDIVKPGQEVKVKVLAVDRQKRQIKLSIKAVDLEEEVIEEDPEEEAPLTAMQIALQRANKEPGQKGGRRQKGRSERDRDRDREDQEDILSRTLANKRK